MTDEKSEQGAGEPTEKHRPGCITAFVILTGIGIVASLFAAFATDVMRQFHPSAPAATVAWCVLGVLMAVGFWQMRRWAFIIYGLLILLAYIVHPLIVGRFGPQVVPGLIVQMIIFAVLLRYRSKMS